ncbi:CD209 antigen-like protein 2 [Ostrea edulis]|uniref:CD209 antigen-like protein 2 n=1 Tax=Ostrea edulis TaxID=37623 RepID=UPI0024AE92AE|nr:CD209 antigen-like protein 2 [Ostrea edulis]
MSVRMNCSCLIIFSLVLEVFSHLEGCHVGWTHFQDKCYFFSHTTASWFDAGEACTQFHSKLAEPRIVTESNFLKSQSQFLNVNMWIGISDIIKEDRWEFSSTQEVVKNTEFGPGEPNACTAENCVALWKDFHGMWVDLACTERLNFICEADAVSDFGALIG